MTNSIVKSTLVFIFTLMCLNVSAQATDKGEISQELVGKWCFLNPANGGDGKVTNTCITLNSDGTYEFFLDDIGLAKGSSFFPDAAMQEFDNGTWSVKGNTIYYSSSANGQGSFQFSKMNQPHNENNPMIIINSQAFANASGKSPW